MTWSLGLHMLSYTTIMGIKELIWDSFFLDTDWEWGRNSQPNLSSYLVFKLSLSNFFSTPSFKLRSYFESRVCGMVFKVTRLFADGIEDIMGVVKLDRALGNKHFHILVFISSQGRCIVFLVWFENFDDSKIYFFPTNDANW